jgi:hypothetical protein
MRFKANFKIVVSDDVDQRNKLGPDVDFVLDDTNALLTKYKASVLTLIGGSAEVEYPFASEGTNGKYLVLQVLAGAVKIKLNDASAPPVGLKIKPAVTPDPILPYQKNDVQGLWYMGPLSLATPLTRIFVQNESATVAARIAIVLVGEAE